MARKIKKIEIKLDDNTTKSFIIKELTVQNIIDLSQYNSFFTDDSSENQIDKIDGESKGFLDDLVSYGSDIEQVMEKTCDFTLQDLKQLAPSDIKKLWLGFREVNHDFLSVLEKVKILEILKKLLEKHIQTFLKVVAI